jgi:hypothetical protein
LNGAFLADRAGQDFWRKKIDWPKLGKRLTDFWATESHRPDVIIELRDRFDAIRYDHRPIDGFTKTDRLKKLLTKN